MPRLLVPDDLPQIAPVDRLAADRAWVEMLGFVHRLFAVALADKGRSKV
ncbi:hypothetical protein [Mesorhizobium sp. B1-1-8]|nr:hypothetical protein [Mesorhizobium sp. B1-1-8]UCI08694.1 hypothetical protein FJ974_06385 [Mesorhizobium sp. B1-1-8]